LKFTADVLNQRAKNKLITDPETSRALVFRIQKKLLDRKRRQIEITKAERREHQLRKSEMKIVLKNPKNKHSNKGSNRISIDDRDRFIQTISKIKTRNTTLTQ